MFDDLLDDELEEAAGPDEEGAVVGIDLGTTNSVVAFVEGGQAHTIEDADGHVLQPSVVAWTPKGDLLVGLPARLRRVIDPTNTVYSAKRIIGQPFRSARVQDAIRMLPYQVVEGERQEPVVVTRAGRFPVPEISSFVLTHLRTIAERRLGKRVTHCVVTVPANFSDGQRAATRLAAERAGMEVLRILNEPTAAALAYGRKRQLHQRIAVFDLGGGTFDVTLLAVRENIYEVLATGGDPFLGGDDIDHKLADFLAYEFLKRHRLDPNSDPLARARLVIAAEQIKMRLSQDLLVEGRLSEVAYGAGGEPLSLDFRIERSKLEEVVEPLVARSLQMAVDVLAEAGVTPDRVDEVILVGGSTYVPLIQQRVAAYFGRKPRIDINPMHVVALGAALHAHSLFYPGAELAEPDGGGTRSAGVLMDVTPHSLGVATAGGYTQMLIPKNTTIPAEGRRVFTTARDAQTAVVIQVCQGEAQRFDDNAPLGELRLDGIEPMPRGRPQVEVEFLIDADGILQVAARELVTGTAAKATLSAVGVNEER